jgi:hypothetical protein
MDAERQRKEMSKTLVCLGPPPHEWEHPGGKGRPPRLCPEHKAALMAAPLEELIEPKPARENPFLKMQEPDNPFLKKLKADAVRENPFTKLKRATPADSPAHGTTIIEKKFEIDQEAQERPLENSSGTSNSGSSPEPEKLKVQGQRPFPVPTSKVEIKDDGKYNAVELPGITIHDFARDTSGEWTCKITVNDETFVCRRHGGWQVEQDDKIRVMLFKIAVVVQEVVRSLEKKFDPPPEHKKKSKTAPNSEEPEVEVSEDEEAEEMSAAPA